MHCQQPTAHCGGGEGGAGREDQARAGKGCVRDSYIMYRPDSPPLIGERAAERGLKLLCAQLGGCCCRWRVDTEEGGPAVDAPKVVDGKVSAATEHPTSIAPSGRPGADRRTPVTEQHPHTPQGERVRHVGRRRGGHMPYSGKREGGVLHHNAVCRERGSGRRWFGLGRRRQGWCRRRPLRLRVDARAARPTHHRPVRPRPHARSLGRRRSRPTRGWRGE